MASPKYSGQRFTYADYLKWPDGERWELIDGEAFAMAPAPTIIEVLSPATARHDHLTKRALYQRAGVREYWLVHPVDRVLTI